MRTLSYSWHCSYSPSLCQSSCPFFRAKLHFMMFMLLIVFPILSSKIKLHMCTFLGHLQIIITFAPSILPVSFFFIHAYLYCILCLLYKGTHVYSIIWEVQYTYSVFLTHQFFLHCLINFWIDTNLFFFFSFTLFYSIFKIDTKTLTLLLCQFFRYTQKLNGY